MIKVSLVASFVIVGGLISSAGAYAQSNKVFAFSSGNWKGSSYYKAGRFSHCQMSASYRNGSKLIFGLEPNKSMSIGILNSRWNLVPGNSEQVFISVDGRTVVWSTAKVIRPQHIAAFFKANSQIYTRMRRGRRLVIQAGGVTLKYSLRGTSRALIRLLNCTISGIKYNRAQALLTPARPPARVQPGAPNGIFNTAPLPRQPQPLGAPPVQPLRPAPVNPNRKNLFSSGNWRGAAYYKKGRFTHCAMSVKYKNGSKLIIGLERTKAMSIGVTHPQWRMTKGQKMGVRFSVDGKPGLSATAKVLSANHYAAFFKSNSEFFQMIRSGNTLAILFGNSAQKFSLAGMYDALRTLLKCTVDAMDAEKTVNPAPPPNPFSSAPGTPPPNPFGNKPAVPANPFGNAPQPIRPLMPKTDDNAA